MCRAPETRTQREAEAAVRALPSGGRGTRAEEKGQGVFLGANLGKTGHADQ